MTKHKATALICSSGVWHDTAQNMNKYQIKNTEDNLFCQIKIRRLIQTHIDKINENKKYTEVILDKPSLKNRQFAFFWYIYHLKKKSNDEISKRPEV